MKISARQKIWFVFSIIALLLFVGFTMIVKFVDVDQVGLAHLNQSFWRLCGQNQIWEIITDWLGYLLILALLGLIVFQVWQWISRKSLSRVDRNLLWLDVICVCLVAVYLFFEIVIINYRPLLDHGEAKASYPSSHVMLFATLLPLLMWQVWYYINSKPWRITLTVLLCGLLVIGSVGRLLSGVHWLTDVIAALIISGALNCLYLAVVKNHK